jgi:hypothetical protein
MSLENSKDALDHGLYLSEVGSAKEQRTYKIYLLSQLYFHIGVFAQEDGKDIATENTIDNIINLLKG